VTTEAARARLVRALVALPLLGLVVAPTTAGAAVALLTVDDDGGGGGGGDRGVAVIHLGNAGVLLAADGRRVVVDALFGDGLPGYATVAPARRAELEAGRGEFAGVDLVLATHAHADHFDAAAVARHLVANPRARFVSTPEAVAAVRAAPGGAALHDRIDATLPAEGGRETLRHAGVTVTAFHLHHGRALRRPVESLGFLVEIGGRRIAHLGDTEATGDELAASGLGRGGVDLALVPFWRLLEVADRAAIERALRPARVAAIHVPRPDADDRYFGGAGGRTGLAARLGGPASGVEILDGAAPFLRLDAATGGRERPRDPRRPTDAPSDGRRHR